MRIGKAIVKGVDERERDPNSAGALIWDVVRTRGVLVVSKFRIRERTCSRVAVSLLACCRFTVIRSRAKSAGFVALGH